MKPMAWSPAVYGAVAGKVHQRICSAVKRSDSGGGILELPGTKVG